MGSCSSAARRDPEQNDCQLTVVRIICSDLFAFRGTRTNDGRRASSIVSLSSICILGVLL